MPSLKDLRARIKSVKNTRQITKTMKMVAAAKVRKARSACENARPYAQHLARVMGNLAAGLPGSGPALLVGREQVQTVRLIVCGADRGLCGAFNANLEKQLYLSVTQLQKAGKFVQIVALGRKVNDYAKRHFAAQYHSGGELGRGDLFDLAVRTANGAIMAFEQGECDAVQLVFAECVTMLTQTPRVQPLIPLQVPQEPGLNTQPEYEPSEEAILTELLPRNIRLQVFRGLLESAASEQAARMNAMDNATRNASDMIKRLSLQYNRSRQAAITKELIEIISGAEAV